MRVALGASIASCPFSSTARSLAASLLLFNLNAPLPGQAAAVGTLPATKRPTIFLRQALAFATPLRHHHQIDLRNNICTSARGSRSRITDYCHCSSGEATYTSVHLFAARRQQLSTAITAAATTMGDKSVGSIGGGGGSSGAGLTLPMFLERCSASAREQQKTRASTSAADDNATAAPTASGSIFHVFSGNEACDADSMCSAMCLAFLRQVTATAAGSAGHHSRESVVYYVPVMPIPRADLALRREVLVLFELCGVDPASVVFSDELDLTALQAEGRLRLTLVDHNAVSGGLAGLGDAVVEIVDHHVDLEQHPTVQGVARDIAFDVHDGQGKALAGSCCTMVAEKMLDQAPASLSSDVARLLLGVILVDTVNLDTEAKRATQRDVDAAEQLSHRISWVSPSAEGRSCTTRDALFGALSNAKMDPAFWRELSVTDCLRYDYKSFSVAGESRGLDGGGGGASAGGSHPNRRSLKFGMSSILCRLQTLAEKKVEGATGVGDSLKAFAASRQLDSLAVMTVIMNEKNELQRELLIFTNTKQRCDQMQEYFEGPNGDFLRLKAATPPGISFGDGSSAEGRGSEQAEGWFLRWELGNTRPSRKQVAPAITAFYESILAG